MPKRGRKKKVKTRVKGNLPSALNRFKVLFLSAVFMIGPIYLYFTYVHSVDYLSDYRLILEDTFNISNSTIDFIAPNLHPYNLSSGIYELFILQMILLLFIVAISLINSIIKKLTRWDGVFLAAMVSKFLNNVILKVMYFRSTMFREIHPYSFYTNEAVLARKNSDIIKKALWITMVIFAASFQFAGLIYIRRDKFPIFFSLNFTILDASVVFMLVTGFFWLILLLGIDLLERHDIQILDLGHSKLFNTGNELNKISRNGMNFLTLSFVILAIQDFNGADWLQTVIFLDLFFLLCLWVLLQYESNLDALGIYIRRDLDKRTLTGAERVIVNREKKRFGVRKLEEAEEAMDNAEKRIELAKSVKFFSVLIDSILVTYLVLLLSTLFIFSWVLYTGEITLDNLLLLEVITTLLVMAVLVFTRGVISKIEIVRRELTWIPLFLIGNIVVTYIKFEYNLNLDVFDIISLSVFLFIWFLLVMRNIAYRAPGSEYWGFFKRMIFFTLMLILMFSTVIYQILVLEYFKFISIGFVEEMSQNVLNWISNYIRLP